MSVEPGDRRHGRRRAGGDHEAARLDLDLVADHDGALVREARRAFDHPHAEAGEALLRIVRRDRRDHARGRDGATSREVDLGAAAADSRRPAPARCARACLAAAISAFDGTQPKLRQSPPMLALLDQHDRHAERGGGGRDRQAARAGADDADVGCQQLRPCAVPSAHERYVSLAGRLRRTRARPQPLHHDRDQCDEAERHQRGQQFAASARSPRSKSSRQSVRPAARQAW